NSHAMPYVQSKRLRIGRHLHKVILKVVLEYELAGIRSRHDGPAAGSAGGKAEIPASIAGTHPTRQHVSDFERNVRAIHPIRVAQAVNAIMRKVWRDGSGAAEDDPWRRVRRNAGFKTFNHSDGAGIGCALK